jgi:hypothetical protein
MGFINLFSTFNTVVLDQRNIQNGANIAVGSFGAQQTLVQSASNNAVVLQAGR